MTYFELVKAIQTACEQHKQLQSYGYGALSNVETPMINGDRRYPYAFLNPQPHQLGEGQIRYRFNLIVMDLAHGDFRDVPNVTPAPAGQGTIILQGEDFVLRAQSDSLQIITDLLARLRYEILDTDVVLQTSVTPFEERFNDTVAGMTAVIEIILPHTLNYCDAPFDGQ